MSSHEGSFTASSSGEHAAAAASPATSTDLPPPRRDDSASDGDGDSDSDSDSEKLHRPHKLEGAREQHLSPALLPVLHTYKRLSAGQSLTPTDQDPHAASPHVVHWTLNASQHESLLRLLDDPRSAPPPPYRTACTWAADKARQHYDPLLERLSLRMPTPLHETLANSLVAYILSALPTALAPLTLSPDLANLATPGHVDALISRGSPDLKLDGTTRQAPDASIGQQRHVYPSLVIDVDFSHAWPIRRHCLNYIYGSGGRVRTVIYLDVEYHPAQVRKRHQTPTPYTLSLSVFGLVPSPDEPDHVDAVALLFQDPVPALADCRPDQELVLRLSDLHKGLPSDAHIAIPYAELRQLLENAANGQAEDDGVVEQPSPMQFGKRRRASHDDDIEREVKKAKSEGPKKDHQPDPLTLRQTRQASRAAKGEGAKDVQPDTSTRRETRRSSRAAKRDSTASD
ncbi:hypothetical protein AC578_6807 [Pseudocercospora eumusae]|uniref:Uncharacterized protein n=1 Tax=Pseudocercospora eumusae TaxID=321146 RepID=A0A139GWD3_9PEZI|nr:hypothetical protein AC578_6807 [Pseudocercospora eumusae]